MDPRQVAARPDARALKISVSTPMAPDFPRLPGEAASAKLRFAWLLVAAVTASGRAAEPPALPPTLEQQLLKEDPAALARAARAEGDPGLGAIAFYQPYLSCTKCHGMGDETSPLGPNLTQPRDDATDTYLVESILQPSKAIRRGFETIVVLTDDGKTLTGLLAEDGPQQLILRDPNDVEKRITIPQGSIDERLAGSTSVMPAGLVNTLSSRQQFLDLARYVMEITEKGPRRAKQLRPPASLYAPPPLPAYETDLDHAGLIRELGDEHLRRGEAIYQSLCVNCHGTRDQPGSLPTSRRFASEPFKSGKDPYGLYQTLTRGYGMMMPQTWMVPQQKYDVIHYLRQRYLKPHNPTQYTVVDEAYLAQLPHGSGRGPAPTTLEPWVSMDYGPHLTASYEVGSDATNFAYKGIAVRLDPGTGGVSRGRYWLLFDHDTLRVAAAWSGTDFIDWNGILFNGRHAVHPRIAGQVHFANPTGPGWAHPTRGDFVDPRLRGRDGRPYGPLPHDWAHYRGLYHFGHRVILSYTVGPTPIQELPGVDATGTVPVFTRTFHIGPRPQPLVLRVAQVAAAKLAHLVSVSTGSAETGPGAAPGAKSWVTFGRELDAGTVAAVRFDGATSLDVARGADFDLTHHDYSIAARIKTAHGGTILCQTGPGERWVPDGKSLFVRDGRLVFDIGWVGAVRSRRAVDDDRWHDIVMTYAHQDGQVRLYIDGQPDGEGRLRPKQDLADPLVRIGYTTPHFPEHQSYFLGQLEDVRFYRRRLDGAQVSGLGQAAVTPDGLLARWVLDGSAGPTVPDATGQGHFATVLRGPERPAPAATVLAGVVPPVPEAAWSGDAEGNLLLRLPAGAAPLRFTLAAAGVASAEHVASVRTGMSADTSPVELAALMRGGPPRWPDKLTTQGLRGDDERPFAVDVLTHPTQNPWRCRTRLTGFDFFPDQRRAAVCTWDGDVWIVGGIDPEAGGAPAGTPTPAAPAATFPLTWQRIASGLFQPLGLKIVDGRIYVACRDQIVILHDLNGDGETDYYENFNNDHQVTEHFHEFAMGLQTDADGNFYYAKSARHALPALVPHHGTVLRVSRDGTRTDILAQGFRAANGVCVNPDGTLLVTDQEGHWTPKNRINWIDRPGKYYGNFWGYHDVTDPADERMEQPVVWITNAMDRSPAELLWVTSKAWGPLQGTLLNTSYGYGKLYVVPHERVGDRLQGGVCEFPLPPFPTGIMRGRFHPVNGQLYTCGMYAWAANPQQPGGFYRVRYTGRPVYLPIGLHARRDGLEITFTGRLHPQLAADPKNYAVKTWTIRRSANYGSEHYDERPLPVTAARLAADGRSVFLTVPEIHTTWCMEIRYAIESADGEYIDGKIHNTIHALGP